MSHLTAAYEGLSDLRLWYNLRSGAPLKLSDLSEIIPLRWIYFRDNWEFVKKDLEETIPQYTFPDELEEAIRDMSDLIEVQRASTNKTTNPFSKASALTDYFAVFDNTLIASLPVSKEEQKIIDRETQRINRFIKTDFLAIRDEIIKARDEIADVIGGSDEDYNNTFNRSSVPELRTASIKDILDMNELQHGINSVDFVLANIPSLNTVNIDPFALARANANNPELGIATGKSGQLVRMFFGDDLQSLATRHLKNPDRWLEIAIANGLKPPYIDEIGTKVLLLSNGSGNQLNLPPNDINDEPNREKLYVSQIVFLRSDTIKFPEQRTIINIRDVPVSGEIVLELDGDNDLDKFKISENANVRVFLPNTANSNFFITIPTPIPLDNQIVGETPFFLSASSEDEKRAGVDLTINDDLDLVFTHTSDLALSYGLANAVQAVQIKMISERGQNPRHATFGLVSIQGRKLDNPDDIKELIVTSIRDMIESDSRFDRVEKLDIRRDQTAFLIDLIVRLAGSTIVVPITFKINTG